MCGITGIYFFDQNRPVNDQQLKVMTDELSHRGPNDEGYFVENNIGLGFRRLSIIDLKLGHQPLYDETGRYLITFNGEIYNYKELRIDLEKMGCRFKTNSDTEVLVNLYRYYKEGCLQYLRGMFSFIIWDKQEKELFGARDRFGIKPFYYYIDDEKFIWASEIKALKKFPNINHGLNHESIDHYFTYGYTPIKETVYNNIHKLEAGSFIKIIKSDKPKCEIRKYWTIDFQPDYKKTVNEWKEELFNTLNDAVRLRMRSDVPLGAFLSGGIDSSIVVALMSKNSDQPINTFSIGFANEEFNELKYAKLVAEKYKTNHHEFIVEPESINILPELVRAYDEPFADDSAIPTYFVSKYTKQYVTVALSGDGGDELFAGYNHYSKFVSIHQFPLKQKPLFTLINKSLPDSQFGKGMSYYLSKESRNIGAYFCFWKDYERRGLYNNDFYSSLKGSFSEKIKTELLNAYHYDFLSNHQKLDMQTFLADDILTKVDIASMMNSLEVRVPILDHKFAELSFKIPSELKMHKKEKKYIFKEAFSHLLPSEILNHKKQGFAVPMKSWFKHDVRDYAHDKLLNSRQLYDYMDKKYIHKLLKDLEKSNRNFGNKVWSLLFFEEWLKQNSI